jgi:hypothetical protein
MDINALLNRKVELIELRDDDDHDFMGHEELELDELIELESDMGITLEEADRYNVYFIDEDYFEDYAKEFAHDIGAINDETTWPATHIDWSAAADELRYDYTDVEFQGNNYLFRY